MQDTEVVVNRGLIDLLRSKEGERKEEEEELITHPNIASNISAQENIMSSNSPMDQNMINCDRFEEDKYPCYDRTDLAYQYALSNHDSNMDPMVLANYAQFMFLVRKDHDRYIYRIHQCLLV